MSLEDSPHVEKRAASVDSTHLLPESTFALVLPVAIVVIFGVESLIGAVPLAVVLYVAAGVPWRVKVGGGLVTLDYLPFGLMRRVFPARSVSGELEYGPERLHGVKEAWASPVLAGGRLYVAGRDGTVEVLELAPEVRTLAVNVLTDAFDASPAVAGNELYLRGKRSLFCVAEPKAN